MDILVLGLNADNRWSNCARERLRSRVSGDDVDIRELMIEANTNCAAAPLPMTRYRVEEGTGYKRVQGTRGYRLKQICLFKRARPAQINVQSHHGARSLTLPVLTIFSASIGKPYRSLPPNSLEGFGRYNLGCIPCLCGGTRRAGPRWKANI